MALSTKYQEFVRHKVREPGSQDFDRGVILWHYTNGAGLSGSLETRTIFSTQASCVDDSAECRFWVPILAKMIDHTNLRPEATASKLRSFAAKLKTSLLQPRW